MTNEMKLLMAMCDAMGFEVEEVEKVVGMGCVGVVDTGEPLEVYEVDYKVTKKSPSINLEVEKQFHDAMQIKLKSQMDEAKDVDRYQALSGRKAPISPGERRLQRKNNVMVALTAELQAGAITQAEFFKKMMELNDK